MRIAVIGVGRIGTLHAQTLAALPGVDELLLCDADASRATAVADLIRAEGHTAKVSAVSNHLEALGPGIDGCIIAAATESHPDLMLAAIGAGIPAFCEKPVAPDLATAQRTAALVRASDVPVQIGFQRRFDPGFMAARAAVASGQLGWIHTVRACTLDIAPPPDSYIPNSGGIFRDCSIHDIDALRYVTGREVVEVYAAGSVLSGEPVFGGAADVDTAAVVLTLDDGAVALLSAARYNASGYDVRMEVHGSQSSIAVGLDDRLPLQSAEAGISWPAGPASGGFLERFQVAYAAEMAAFMEVTAGKCPSPCSIDDGLAASLIADACDRSRRQHRPITLAEVSPDPAAAGSQVVA